MFGRFRPRRLSPKVEAQQCNGAKAIPHSPLIRSIPDIHPGHTALQGSTSIIFLTHPQYFGWALDVMYGVTFIALYWMRHFVSEKFSAHAFFEVENENWTMHLFIFALIRFDQNSALLPLYALFGDPIDGCSDTQMKRGDSTPFIHPILHLTSTLTDTYILQPPYSYSTPTLSCTPFSYLISLRAECSPAYHP